MLPGEIQLPAGEKDETGEIYGTNVTGIYQGLSDVWRLRHVSQNLKGKD